MRPSIILIGPGKTGKSTLSKRLGEALSLPALDLDDLRWDYYAEIGYDAAYVQMIRQRDGFEAVAAYWKPFDIHGVERVLQDYPTDHVIAFGAGHSVYADPSFRSRAERAFAPFPHVVLILPTPDVEESFMILRERMRRDDLDLSEESIERISAVNRTFLVDPSNARLAKLTVYTKGKSVEVTCQEILSQLLMG